MPRFIGVCGKARSGKDTLARFMADEIERKGKKVAILSLATPIKDMLAQLLSGMRPRWYEKREFLEKCYEGEYKEIGIEELNGLSPRRLMQTLGTEWGRALDEDIWIRVLQAKVDREYRDYDYIIIPDVRYDNEAEYINDTVILVTRSYSADVVAHASEIGVSEYLIEVEVFNDAGIDELADAGRLIVEEVVRVDE